MTGSQTFRSHFRVGAYLRKTGLNQGIPDSISARVKPPEDILMWAAIWSMRVRVVKAHLPITKGSRTGPQRKLARFEIKKEVA